VKWFMCNREYFQEAYRNHRFRLTFKQNAQTGMWGLEEIWSETDDCALPLPPEESDPWEAIYAGQVSHYIMFGRDEAQRVIAQWLDKRESK
jgi:hypothetical protein